MSNKARDLIEGAIICIAFLFTCMVLSAHPAFAKDCSVDNSASLTPLYPGPIVDTGSLKPGDIITGFGESNTKQMFDYVEHADVVVDNSGTGGCTIGGIARGDDKCWNNLHPNPDVIALKPINRSQGREINLYLYGDGTSRERGIYNDTIDALNLINVRRPSVDQVWLIAHHATPWSEGWISKKDGKWRDPKQGEPYSWWSGQIMREIADNPPPGLNFDVVFTTYLWANGTTPRADGAVWACDDFVDDGVHQSTAAKKKSAGMIIQSIDVALGNPPGDDEPPVDDEPQQCEQKPWATRQGKVCDWVPAKERCICR